MTRDERADRLALIASQLVTMVRDEAPEVVHRWLRAQMEGEDWCALAVVQACATPDDRPWRELTAWTLIGDGRPDTPEAVQQRRRVLLEATAGADPRRRGNGRKAVG